MKKALDKGVALGFGRVAVSSGSGRRSTTQSGRFWPRSYLLARVESAGRSNPLGAVRTLSRAIAEQPPAGDPRQRADSDRFAANGRLKETAVFRDGPTRQPKGLIHSRDKLLLE